MADERGIIHRDLIAHALRWSHVAKFLARRHSDAIVLDVGCGREVPLARTLYSNRFIPKTYLGVDYNKLEMPEMLAGRKWARVQGGVDASFISQLKDAIQGEDGEMCPPNVVVSFEMLEHVTPKKCRETLLNIAQVANQDADFFFSTPCWNGNAADNHINEMTYLAFGSLLEDCGYNIRATYGTFASQSDYVKHMIPEDLQTYERLKDYYDSNLLSVIFAPLYPRYSRNCLWHCILDRSSRSLGLSPRFGFKIAPEPWSQHTNWKDLAG